MDFSLPYTEEQERFRQEVRAWFDDNIPQSMRAPVDPNDYNEELYSFWRGMHKKLAAKGWLFPTYPKEYGGGSLTPDHEAILQEEFRRARTFPEGHRGYTNNVVLPALLVWATEEQKQKFLVPILTAEKVAFQGFTEPQSGADLANTQSRAVRDGDDWILTGQKVFIGGHGDPDLLYCPMMTDTDAPRHRNLGYFMVPVPTPGLELKRMNLIHGQLNFFIFFDNVRIPGDHLIGGDHQGWQVAGSTLEQEHGGRGQAAPADDNVEALVSYAQSTIRDGISLGKNPVVQQAAMEAYIDFRRNSLLALRTFWMYTNRTEVTYEGNVSSVHGRESSLRNVIRVRDVYGMYALLGAKDPIAPHGGEQEVNQRSRAGQNHAGGSTNIAKVVLARRIGISRTKERPAPTPATATSYGG